MVQRSLSVLGHGRYLPSGSNFANSYFQPTEILPNSCCEQSRNKIHFWMEFNLSEFENPVFLMSWSSLKMYRYAAQVSVWETNPLPARVDCAKLQVWHYLCKARPKWKWNVSKWYDRTGGNSMLIAFSFGNNELQWMEVTSSMNFLKCWVTRFHWMVGKATGEGLMFIVRALPVKSWLIEL